MRKQRVILEHRIHVALPRRQFAGRFTKNANGAARKLFKPGNQAQAGGFAGAGGPQHGEKFAIANGDADAVHRPHVAVQPRNIIELYRVHVLRLRRLNDRP